MKKSFIIILAIVFVFLGVNILIANKSFSEDLTEMFDKEAIQNAIRETAFAYYNRGANTQYCIARLSYIFSPEEATSQHTTYSVCSSYTYSVYNQGFEDTEEIGGMKIAHGTNLITAYGKTYYDKDNITENDVIEYWEGKGQECFDNKGNKQTIDLSTESGIKQYLEKKLLDLEVGDILCYHWGQNGHAQIVYEIIYNNSGKPIDAIILDSGGQYETKSTKITQGLSYFNKLNENTGIKEGTYRRKCLIEDTERPALLKELYEYGRIYKLYFTIYRPLLRKKDEYGNIKITNTYYKPSFSSKTDETGPLAYTCSREKRYYKIAEIAEKRNEYSKIGIEKTVDVFNNSVVNLGDTLRYTIKVSNNSDKNYTNVLVKEKLSTYVEAYEIGNATKHENENAISWNIPTLGAGEEKIIKYRVKVKNNISALGKEIVSTGTVAGIPSATVTNTISNNLKDTAKQTIKEKTKTVINQKSKYNKDFITEIYKNSFNVELNLDKLDITKLVVTSDGIRFYPEDSTSDTPAIKLNKDNEFSNIVLPNYYGGLYTTDKGEVQLKYWEFSNPNRKLGRSKRADTIYKENFQTGDILIYKNKQVANANVNYKSEDGTYYWIYISEADKITINNNEVYGFVGVNAKYEIVNISTESLQTLLGKDYYVVLRPSMNNLPIQLDKEEINLKIGKKSSLRVLEQPTTTVIEWTSSDESVAIVSENGIVTAVGDGMATIQASTTIYGSDELYIATCRVYVQRP